MSCMSHRQTTRLSWPRRSRKRTRSAPRNRSRRRGRPRCDGRRSTPARHKRGTAVVRRAALVYHSLFGFPWRIIAARSTITAGRISFCRGGANVLRTFFSNRPELKSTREIALMREAGKIVAEALRLCRSMAKPGTKTTQIDQAGDALYKRYDVQPLFKGYPGQRVPFPASTCISINEQVVHGIPGQRVLREGDLLKIDTACKLKGWCADAAITVPIGEVTA